MNIKNITSIESLVLCKLNKRPIGELSASYITSYESYMDEISKITLKIYKNITSQVKKQNKINPLYDEIKSKRYLLLNDKDYYIIEDIKESKISGIKEVTAYSGEQILTRRPIELEDFGIQILEDDIDNNIYSLNTLLAEVGWKLGHVDDSVVYVRAESMLDKEGNNLVDEAIVGEAILGWTEENRVDEIKLRWQESVNNNWLDFIKTEIAEQFECLPVFHPESRTIDLYDINTLGEEIKICLTKDNYIKSKTKTKNSEELITLLKLKGADELNIEYHILGGYNFITNFSYFIETNEMSDELINALNKYDEMIKIRHPIWQELINEKTEKEDELLIKRNKWTISISTIDCYKSIIDKYIVSQDVENETRVRVQLSEELDKELILRLEIEDLLEQIDLIQESIDNINLLCKYETCTDENGNLVFNEDTLDELQEFIFVDTYSDDSFVNAEDLLEKGKNVLNERCRPTMEVEIDSINFMNRIIDNDFRLRWNGDLSFGDIVVLIDEDTDEEEYYYFLGYDIDYSSNSLTLKISNKKTLRENTKTINNWLKEMKKTKSLLISNKHVFNKVKQNRLNIDKNDVR